MQLTIFSSACICNIYCHTEVLFAWKIAIIACMDTVTSLVKGSYHTKCAEKHIYKKIDRNEMKKKSYIGPCCSAPVDGASYSSLLDETVD